MDAFHLVLPPLFLFLYTITIHLLHKLYNLPPTPFPSLPFFGHLYFFTNPTLPSHRVLSRLSRLHGPILFLRLGARPALLVSSPSAAQQCLAKNDSVFANRPNLLNGRHFGYNFTSLAWAPHGDHWRNLRRLSALHLLSAHKLDELSTIRVDSVRTLVRKLVKIHALGEAIDMKELFFEHAYEVVTGMLTGRAEATESGEQARMFGEIVAEMSAVTAEANVVDFLPYVRWFGLFGGVERKMRLLQGKRDRFMEGVVEKHRGEGGGGDGGAKSFIGVMMDLQRAEPEYYTDEMIRNLLLVLVQGASHASSTTLEWAFSLLLEDQHRHILARVRSDIDEVVGKHRLLGDSDLSKLPYLQCIIKETLRMHPAAPLLTPHVASEECHVEGHRVPHGTMLLVNAWEIHNNPETWKDPEEFMPERFQGGKKGGLEFVAFGWGRRGCPGEKLAVQMVGVALGCLIQCFEWDKIGENIDMKEGKGVITPRAQPLRARLLPRPFLAHLIAREYNMG